MGAPNPMEINSLVEPNKELEADESTTKVAPLQDGDRDEMKVEKQEEPHDEGINLLVEPDKELEADEPTTEVAPVQDDEKKVEKKEKPLDEEKQEEDRFELLASKLELKLPTREESKLVDGGQGEDDDGFNTPTSEEHRIPAMLECPPAPKKPRPTRRKRRYQWINTLPEAEFDLLFSDYFPLRCASCGAQNLLARQGNDTE